MSEPDPILSYATPPARRVPIYIALILILWAIVDFLGGILFTLGGGFFLFLSEEPHRFEAIPFVLIGPVLLFWFLLTAHLITGLFKGKTDIVLRALKLTRLAELLTWPISLLLYAHFATREHAWSDSGKLRGWSIGLAVLLVIPLSVTATRILLRRTTKQFPRPVDDSTT